MSLSAGYPRTDFIGDGDTVLKQLSVNGSSKQALMDRQLLFLLGCLTFAAKWIQNAPRNSNIAVEWKNYLREPKHRKELHTFAAKAKKNDFPEVPWGEVGFSAGGERSPQFI